MLELPRLLGTRSAAADVIKRANVPANLDDDTVIVLGNSVASVSASYADELVKQLFEERHAREILLVGASPHLEERLKDAASRRNIKGAVRPMSPSEAGV